jgi:hypothetical protein
MRHDQQSLLPNLEAPPSRTHLCAPVTERVDSMISARFDTVIPAG